MNIDRYREKKLNLVTVQLVLMFENVYKMKEYPQLKQSSITECQSFKQKMTEIILLDMVRELKKENPL